MSLDIESDDSRFPYAIALIVEDDINTAEYLQEVLRMRGCRAAIANTGSDALQIARSLGPELVICDLQLPDMLGSLIATNLRKSSRTTESRLVALSGYSDDEHRSEALKAGFDSFLVKPVRLDTLLQHLSDSTHRDSDAPLTARLSSEWN